MAIVIVVMFIAARVMKNRNISMAGGSVAIGGRTHSRRANVPMVEVLGRQGVGKGASVSVVRAGGKTLVLGITDHQVSLLAELQLEATVENEVLDQQPVSAPVAPLLSSVPNLTPANGEVFKNILDQVRERTVRKTS